MHSWACIGTFLVLKPQNDRFFQRSAFSCSTNKMRKGDIKGDVTFTLVVPTPNERQPGTV